MKSVMVTGADGFIGSHLVRKLLNIGIKVFACDLRTSDQCVRIADLLSNPNLYYSKVDIRDFTGVKGFFQADADVLFHLASVVGVNKYIEDPFSLIDVSIMGTRNLAALAVEHKVRTVFASTSEIYGKNEKVYWSEDDNRVLGSTTVDRWCYSSAKAVCEHMLFGLYRQHSWPMSIVRFFNVYGPAQQPIFVVSQSIKKVLNGEKPIVYDSGEQTRCLTYVADIIDGLMIVATKPEAVGEVFNLGSGFEINMRDLVEKILQLSNSEIRYEKLDTTVFYGQRYEDISRRVPNPEKAWNVLGWEATTNIEKGLSLSIDWAREHSHFYANTK